MAQNGKLTPNLDEKSTKLLNLTVLQRIDPFVEEILITAAHVTFYEFNIDTSQWSRKDVEGSLFVVKRNAQPRFQFIVMNRRSTENLVENLLEDFEFEVQVPYLLYRNASQEVNGIWFYNAHECEEVANLFTRLLNAYAKVPGKTKISPSRSEFEELEAVPTMEVIDGPLEPSSASSTGHAITPDDRAFVNFFSSAVNVENPPGATSRHTYQSPAPSLPAHTAVKSGSGPNVAMPYQPPQGSAPVDPPVVSMPFLPVSQVPSSMPSPNPLLSLLDISEPGVGIKRSSDLVKPSSFFAPSPSTAPLIIPPISSSIPTAPPLSHNVNGQRPYGTPLLQPFPPPTPPPSLTPAPAPIYGPVISRDKIREALQMLVQDNQFIDMVYQAVLRAHQS